MRKSFCIKSIHPGSNRYLTLSLEVPPSTVVSSDNHHQTQSRKCCGCRKPMGTISCLRLPITPQNINSQNQSSTASTRLNWIGNLQCFFKTVRKIYSHQRHLTPRRSSTLIISATTDIDHIVIIWIILVDDRRDRSNRAGSHSTITSDDRRRYRNRLAGLVVCSNRAACLCSCNSGRSPSVCTVGAVDGLGACDVVSVARASAVDTAWENAGCTGSEVGATGTGIEVRGLTC